MTEFTRRYQQLNPAQKQAVDTIDGPVLVIAGPGTGKTELLSTRVANILKKTDTTPDSILCLTFTDSGADSMRRRLIDIIGKDAYKVAIYTFHSFGSEMISRYREYFYNGAIFSLADDPARYEIIKDIFDSLEYNNILASKMNDEYSHLGDTQTVISELKRAGGLTSDELLAILQQDMAALDEIAHFLLPVVGERISKNSIDKYSQLLDQLHEVAVKFTSLYEVTPLATVMHSSLSQAVSEATREQSTKPLTNWKRKWTKLDDQKNLVFSDIARIEKLKALSYIYYEYINRMQRANLYDYDDMILQVVHAMEVNDDLRYNLQEQYLYIMVDEFQDTNLAQMRILHNLTDNSTNEGKPNILAVGDDDQAVYGFQGADVSNILNFREHYPGAKLITLTENYRSGENILGISRQVISQGTDRLENRMPDELNKQLSAEKIRGDNVSLLEFPSIHDERYTIAEQISQKYHRLVQRQKPVSIAVIGRKHEDIIALVPYLNHFNVPIRYEKKDNALEQEPIKTLELISRLIIDLAKGNHQRADALLPELLSHPAWGLAPQTIWQLSVQAKTNHQSWMQALSVNPDLKHIHDWLTVRAVAINNLPLENMLDLIIGQDDSDGPFFSYYFSPETLQNTPEKYYDYLTALRIIREKLREYATDRQPNLYTFLEFIDVYRRLKIPISTPRMTTDETTPAIDLLTAHKSKGMEFDEVYVINATDSRWGSTTRPHIRNILYPENIPFDPAGDTADERLRLFYVAMTRAKQSLVISYSTLNDSDKATMLADFLVSTSLTPILQTGDKKSSNPLVMAQIAWHEKLSTPEKPLKQLLQPQLDNFRLSPTAMTTFLDVANGGPRNFLLNNLLGFPSAPSDALAYGNAIHSALQQAHTHLVATGQPRPLEDILHDFEVALSRQHLAHDDYLKILQKGSDQLPIFLKSPVAEFNANQLAELSFYNQEVVYGDAHLTGKIDVLEVNKDNKSLVITDYKTGHPAKDFRGSTEYEKQKLHKYRLQLLFYGLLVIDSRDYSRYTLQRGRLVFVEPTKSGYINALDLDYTAEELERTAELATVVWQHIVDLDIPDTSDYSPNLKGIEQFEADLLDGKV